MSQPETFTFTKDSLLAEYKEAVVRNPKLGRISVALSADGWSQEEIVMAQLVVAVHSNASLFTKLTELQNRAAQTHG